MSGVIAICSWVAYDGALSAIPVALIAAETIRFAGTCQTGTNTVVAGVVDNVGVIFRGTCYGASVVIEVISTYAR